MRCTDWRSGCCWSGKLLNLSNLTPDDEEYWTDKDNWQFLVKETAEVHTCTGIEEADIAKFQFSKFVRNTYNDGETEFGTIRAMSGIDTEFHDHGGTYTEDDVDYER